MSLDNPYRRRVRRVLRVATPLLRVLLRSRAHRPASRRLLLLSFTGLRSGASYTFPVGYRRDGPLLKVITANHWWRNLRAPGTPVTVWLHGRRHAATARAYFGDEVVAADLPGFLAHNPSLARLYGIETDQEGRPGAQSVSEVAKQVAVVHIALASPPP